MIYKHNDIFRYAGNTYTVGELVYANKVSDYYGLIGVIKEVRTGKDKETENSTPDVYVDFSEPVLKADKERLVALFNGEEDLPLDGVIMAPEMIEPLSWKRDVHKIKVYVIREKWAYDGDEGETCSAVYMEKEEALKQFRIQLDKEREDGIIGTLQTSDDFVVDESENSYFGYIEGFAAESNYEITLSEEVLEVGEEGMEMLGTTYMEQKCRELIMDQIEDWEERAGLTNKQYECLINDPEIQPMIEQALKDKTGFWETFWEAVSEVAFKLVAKHSERK